MTLKTFNSRPVTINAIQWTGENAENIYDIFRAMGIEDVMHISLGEFQDRVDCAGNAIPCQSATGEVYAQEGMYIIFNGVDDIYPCPEETFLSKYTEQTPSMGLDLKTMPVAPLSYYGTKRVHAWPHQKGEEEGYAVEYEDGYISWSPKDVFEATYQPTTAMSFGHAIVAMKTGYRVARAGWNGKGMFLFKVAGSQFEVNREPLKSILGEGTVVNYLTHYDMRTADGSIVPWLCSQADMDADDWLIV
jgi:hypothetical protein